MPDELHEPQDGAPESHALFALWIELAQHGIQVPDDSSAQEEHVPPHRIYVEWNVWAWERDVLESFLELYRAYVEDERASHQFSQTEREGLLKLNETVASYVGRISYTLGLGDGSYAHLLVAALRPREALTVLHWLDGLHLLRLHRRMTPWKVIEEPNLREENLLDAAELRLRRTLALHPLHGQLLADFDRHQRAVRYGPDTF